MSATVIRRRYERLSRTNEMAPDETLPGYLDRLAWRLRLPLTDLLREVGLAEARGDDLAALSGSGLSERQIRSVADSLGLPEKTVRESLLTRYDGMVFDLRPTEIRDAAWRADFATREWVFVAASNLCPTCLGEADAATDALGVWRVAWKLPWTFACTQHRCLLLDTCPQCQLQPRSGSAGDFRSARSGSIPDPLRCGNTAHPDRRGYRSPCGHHFGRGDATPLGDRRLLGAQTILDLAREGQPPDPYGGDSLDFFNDMRAMCTLLLRVATPNDLGESPPAAFEAFAAQVELRERIRAERDRARAEGSTQPRLRTAATVPRSSALMAAIVPTALQIVTARSDDELRERLQWLLDRALDDDASAVINMKRASAAYRFSPRLSDAVDGCRARHGPMPTQLVWRRRTRQPHLGVDQLPQLFWSEPFESQLAELFARGRKSQARRYCSIVSALMLGADTVGDAVVRLGLPANAARTTYSYISALRAEGTLDALNDAIDSILRAFDAKLLPDLAERRRRFNDLPQLPADVWKSIARNSEIRQDLIHDPRYAAAWLWEELAGGDARLAPALNALASLSGQPLPVVCADYQRFCRSKRKPAIEGALRLWGEEWLNS